MNEAKTEHAAQFLTFTLDEEIFAFDISKVREVLDFMAITKVPNTPGFMRGVINLRGSVVPVIDLRLKFGMMKAEKVANTCIIIVEVTVDNETITLGALADSVQEVINLAPEQMEPAPKIGTRLRTEFITGMGIQNDKFIIILDINKIFSTEEIIMVRADQGELGEVAVTPGFGACRNVPEPASLEATRARHPGRGARRHRKGSGQDKVQVLRHPERRDGKGVQQLRGQPLAPPPAGGSCQMTHSSLSTSLALKLIFETS